MTGSVPGTTESSPAAMLCPFCRSPMEVTPAKRRRTELRRCPHCEAELRDAGDGQWRLQYVHPDWLPHMRREVDEAVQGRLGPLLLQTALWYDWPLIARGERVPQPVEAPRPPAPSPDEPMDERVVVGYARARLVLVATHHVWHASGPDGVLWLTDGSLAFEAGEYRWRVPWDQVRQVEFTGGMLEILWGPTREPAFVALDGAWSAAESVARARSGAPGRTGPAHRP